MTIFDSEGNTKLFSENGNLVANYSGKDLPLFLTGREFEGVNYMSGNPSDLRTDWPSSTGYTSYAEVFNGIGIFLNGIDMVYPEQYSYQQPEGEPGYYFAYLFSIDTGHLYGQFFEYKIDEQPGISYGTYNGTDDILGNGSEYASSLIFGPPDDPDRSGSYVDAKNYFRDVIDPYHISIYLIDDQTNVPLTNTVGREYTLDGIKDYDGNLHANTNSVSTATKNAYKYNGLLDVNLDGVKEAIYTNKESGRWVTASVDALTGTVDFSDYGKDGTTRVVGIYIDPLVTSGEVEQFGPYDSQRRFQIDLKIDNLIAKTSGDYDGDGVSEVYWKTADGTAYLRALMHDDGNIRYANYQSEAQMTDYLTTQGHESVVEEIV